MPVADDPANRPPLNRDRVLGAAIDVADREGLSAVTMRRLGAELGFEAMSLYKHVAGKDAILDGIVDVVIGQIELPAAGSDWRTAMRRRAVSARHVLASHPWAIGMMEARASLGPAAMRYVDAVIGSLRAGGFPVELAAHAFMTLDSYVYGFVVQETNFRFGTADEPAEPSPDDRYQHLAEMAAAYVTGSGHELDDEFEFGLELILDGLERHLGR